MQLTKLEMAGFKSFADKTEFLFQPGITALVGPNGCGKSNVVDAVRWILGEQRARVIRASEMAEVIFNGTETRRSMGYAEASITVLNDRHELPVDYDEVRLTRRIYRSGESEYLLNGAPCRLRDIRSLFTDTGVGMDTYSIIEQGQVDRVLQSNAQERRVLFEEAAGISGYKEQRRQTLIKLDRCRQNLLRVGDLIQEKEKRLRSIRNQAARARRHSEYSARLRELAVALAQRNYAEFETRLATLREQIRARENQHGAAVADIERAEREALRLQELARQQQEAANRIEQRIHLVEAGIANQGERLRSAQLRAQEHEEAADAASRSIGSAGEKLNRARADLESTRRELTERTADVERRSAEVETAAAQAAEAARRAAEQEKSLEARKAEVWECLQECTRLRNRMVQTTGRIEQEQARRARLQTRGAEVGQELDRLARERRGLEAGASEFAEQTGDLERSIAASQEEARRLDRELEALGARQADLQADRAALRSRRDVLSELEGRASGVQQGVRHLLGEGRAAPRIAGIGGMVADLIQVDLHHAAAVEAALGERAQYIVCENTATARAALHALRRDRAGRAAMLPADRCAAPIPAGGNARAHRDQPGVVAAAPDLVRCDTQTQSAINRLLDDTLVVASLDDAMRLTQNGCAHLRLVTLRGEIVEPWGAVIGGDGQAAGGIISRRSELRDIERRLGALAAEARRMDALRHELVQRANTAADRRRALEAELAGARQRLVELEKRREVLDAQQKRFADERDVTGSELQEIEDTLKGYLEERTACQGRLDLSEQRYAQVQEAIDAAMAELDARRRRAAQRAEQVTALRVKLAHETEQRDSLRDRVGPLEQQLEEYGAEMETARAQVETHRKRRAEAEQQAAEARQRAAELAIEKTEREAELASQRQQYEATRGELASADRRTRALRDRAAELQQDLEKLRIQENEGRVRRDDLADRAQDEFEVNLAALAGPEPGRDWDEVKAGIANLQRKLRHLGPVNLEAIHEQEELEKAVAFETAQRADLEQAEHALNDLIARLNKICRERFLEAFEHIRGNFRELFRKLFGGGKADLILQGQVAEEGQEKEDVLEAGIEIVASPPGKELGSIRQLSGGEKTLTTLALLFAIFRAKPSPFCILDEVDAALDESNVDRFTQVLRDFLDRSQFVIITHSKRTVAMADVLYGITMEEKGVSKRVAVKLSQAMDRVA